MNRNAMLVSTLLAVMFALPAQAEIGKKVSMTADTGAGSGLVPAFPTTVSYMTVGLPSGYKSKANFLKVTVSYQTGCNGGDAMSSKVDVGPVTMTNGSQPYEAYDEDANFQIVTKVYWLAPESQGGPALDNTQMVTARLSSNLGTGCFAGYGTMTVEALK